MPHGGTALPGWLKPANKLVKGLHRAGLPLGTTRVLTAPGRASGLPRATPVSPLTVDRREYVIAAVPDADWALNARAAGSGSISKGRETRAVDLVEVHDPALRRAVMRAFPQKVPHGVQFFVRIGLVERGDPDEFEAAADQVAVFEIRGST
jgi:hypothetical protein